MAIDDQPIPKVIRHPMSINGNMYPMSTVLRDLAAQEGCDNEPYDTMMLAAEYIDQLESKLTKPLELIDSHGVYLYTGLDEGGCADVGKVELRGYNLISDARLTQLSHTPTGEMILLLKEIRELMNRGRYRIKASEMVKIAERITVVLNERAE